MRQLFLLVTTLVFSHLSFSSSHTNSLKSLNSAWHKNHASVTGKQVQDDLDVVYGGEDISRRPTLVFHGATA